MIENGKLYRHKKTGGFYHVVLEDAIIEATMERAVIYRALSDNKVWVRPYSEFADGRFELAAGQ